jgi:hypothetical protein
VQEQGYLLRKQGRVDSTGFVVEEMSEADWERVRAIYEGAERATRPDEWCLAGRRADGAPEQGRGCLVT